MGEDGAQAGHTEAQAMLDAFASVGAIRFNVTWTTRAGEKRWFKRSVSIADVASRMPAMLDTTTPQEINVIVRPYGPGVTFIQLVSMAVRIRVNPAATENLAWRLLAGVRRSLPSFDQKPTMTTAGDPLQPLTNT
jgi:hypothetical protein